VIESFAEVELPQPWTSFKGVGSIVCYLNNETNDTTWKHPFYDYFAQLLNHCRRSTREDHVKLRINRILWSYEAESQIDLQSQMPLVSPKYVKILAEILGIDLGDEPYLVRTLKTFLRAFAQMYHEGELDVQEVKWCCEIIHNERAKLAVMKQLPYEADANEQLDTGDGQVYCVECGSVADCYCPECSDCMCVTCFERLHARGNRASHEPNYFISCGMCKTTLAKLQCTYSRGQYCVECYTRKHSKSLPKFLELRPLKIDYKRSAKLDREEQARAKLKPYQSNLPDPIVVSGPQPAPEADPDLKDSFSKPAPLETLLGERWHAFYDLRGVKYYYNFDTQESMRRPQDDLMMATTPSRPSPPHASHSPDEPQRTRRDLVRFIAGSQEARQLPDWREGVEKRARTTTFEF